MMFTKTLFTTAMAATSALAAPAGVKSMMSTSSSDWTIESLSRACNDADTSCTWHFWINNGNGDDTECNLVVEADSQASRANGGPSDCGIYTVTSGWSGQFGDDQGFTVLSVVDYDAGLIVYPGYTDKQVAGGDVVSPDQSYTPQGLP